MLTKQQRKFWAVTKGGIFECPECGGIVAIYDKNSDYEVHDCKKCGWMNYISLRISENEDVNSVSE